MRTTSTSGCDDVLCPLFRGHGSNELICASDIPDAQTHLHFKTAAQKKQQFSLFCEGCYKMCPHFQSVIHWDWEDDRA